MRFFFLSRLLVCSALPTFSLVACREDQERPEVVAKLRAIGAATSPVIQEPSTADLPKTVTVTFYALLPKNTQATASPYVDEADKYGKVIPLTVIPGTETYDDAYSSFVIYSVKATLPVPTNELLHLESPPGFARLRYGLKITAAGETENIVGNALVYKAGSPELSWQAPTIDVASPSAGALITGKQDLKATLKSGNGENLRVSWYVASGEVKNRRAKETEWEKAERGSKTIVLTARGLKSGAFAFKALDVNVE